jgi:hypothetical protein
MINQRIFSANVGDSSVGIAGPDAIEQDIDNLLANDQELLGQINNLDADTVDTMHIWVGAEGSKGTDANTIYFCY